MWYRTCSDVMHASCSVHTQASQPPYVYVAYQELLMDMPFMQAKLCLSKLTASHFGKYKICKPERAGKDSHYHAQ